jgi:hypothetical protein
MMPETQYFWSEYEYEKGIDQVMLGQKWIKRNELLKIDIIPNENIKIYEKLRYNLSYLKSSFEVKIKRKDDETDIISDYDTYITNNEIYMVDIYNELGINYNPDMEDKKNLYDVYINIYFPFISFERLEQIINLLNGKNDKELTFIDNVFRTLHNDIKIENEIEQIIEKTKTESDKYNDLFYENYIIHSNIHVNIYNPKNITGTISLHKFNLYRIFDNFIVSDKYPFIQYQTPDSQIIYKLNTLINIDKDSIINTDLLAKWFENTPYGISFKIKIENNKYISISLFESGKIEYKITWKEEEKATIANINKTYDYVRDLILKINSENKKIKIILPENENFKYAYINTIQKFKIPDKFKINHNDLSDFCRFFFTHVAVVIEPRKRESKKGSLDNISKYGTYLRFKRISKYDNTAKMHMRILYFIRNYDLNDKELVDEISKQFNITPDVAIKELEYVKEKFNKIIKKTKKLKKFKALPKSKAPGINIDIQGKEADNYKIRITGARNNLQLDSIILFIKVLLYLYIQTYLYQKKEYQKIKDTLYKLTNIAKRRNKVNDVAEYESTTNEIKNIIKLDKARLGFKPTKGQNQWTRSCQNSGTDKKRQPNIFGEGQLNKLLEQGYKLNEKTGFYEKKVEMKIKKKIYSTIIKAVKLPGENNTFNYYTCDPSHNNDQIFIGFLSKGNNPNNLCMPCCYKKDPTITPNKAKKNYYMKCIGEQKQEQEEITKINLGEKLYILQDTNKIQDNRFILLPEYLDILFNKLWNYKSIIKNHFLTESKTGYFFKYTIKQNKYFLLSTLSNIFDVSIETIINNMVDFINNDKYNIYFTFLNNGDIITSFSNKSQYIDYLLTSNYLEYDIIGELTSIPGIVSPNGIKYYILNKESITIKSSLEKDIINDKYFIEILNLENYNEDILKKDVIFLIKDDTYYFPIYYVKKDKSDTKIILKKHFNTKDNSNIINELNKYYNIACKDTLINSILFNFNYICKNIIFLLDNKVKILCQIIDERHKCRYILLENGLLLPTKPSGINYNYKIDLIDNINKYVLELDKTIKLLENIEKILKLDYIPTTIYYDERNNNDITIVYILLKNNMTIPIISNKVNINDIKNKGLAIRYQSINESIDIEISKYNKLSDKSLYNNNKHNLNVRTHMYMSESYNLFRLELSLYLNNNDDIKNKIINIIRKSKISINDKKHELRKILLEISNKKLYNNYMKGGTLIESMNELPDLKSYNINNIREQCNTNLTQDKCNNNKHCSWNNNICRLQLLDSMIIDFINRIIEEFLEDSIKFKEVIQENDYFVSDIVDYTYYTNRENQKIITTANFNAKKLVSSLFGKDKVPNIGKNSINLYNNDTNVELIKLGKQYIQEIIPNNYTIIRAYINSYYWLKNQLYDISSRNLGYISYLQTVLTYIFKANIIDYITLNIKQLQKYITHYDSKSSILDNPITKLRKSIINTNGKLELLVLSHLVPIPIIVYDNYSNVKYIFLQGEIPVSSETLKNFITPNKLTNSIVLKFNFNNSDIPNNVFSLYYI